MASKCANTAVDIPLFMSSSVTTCNPATTQLPCAQRTLILAATQGKQEGTTRWPIDYDAVIGIWQSVWLEPVHSAHLLSIGSRYDMDAQELQLTCELSEAFTGTLTATPKTDTTMLGTMQADAHGRSEIRLTLAVENPQLWSPETPHLYDLELQLVDASAQLIDQVHSYTGLRELTVSSGRHCLNGKPLYLRGILDQGYFPEGWYSPADDQAMQQDIELTKAMGFNFARKHQKSRRSSLSVLGRQNGLIGVG